MASVDDGKDDGGVNDDNGIAAWVRLAKHAGAESLEGAADKYSRTELIVCKRIELIDCNEDKFVKCELIKPVGCDAIEPFGYADTGFSPCNVIVLAGFHQLNVVERRNIETIDCSETELTAHNGAALIEPNAFELLARRDGRFVKCDKLKPVEYGAIESVRSDIEFVKSGGVALAATHGFELISVAIGCHQRSVADCRDVESIDCDETDLIECSGAELIGPNAFESFERGEDRCVNLDKVRPVECGAIGSARYGFEFIKSGEIGSATTHGFGSIIVANGCLQLRVVEC
jgi:hypothetical protein